MFNNAVAVYIENWAMGLIDPTLDGKDVEYCEEGCAYFSKRFESLQMPFILQETRSIMLRTEFRFSYVLL